MPKAKESKKDRHHPYKNGKKTRTRRTRKFPDVLELGQVNELEFPVAEVATHLREEGYVVLCVDTLLEAVSQSPLLATPAAISSMFKADADACVYAPHTYCTMPPVGDEQRKIQYHVYEQVLKPILAQLSNEDAMWGQCLVDQVCVRPEFPGGPEAAIEYYESDKNWEPMMSMFDAITSDVAVLLRGFVNVIGASDGLGVSLKSKHTGVTVSNITVPESGMLIFDAHRFTHVSHDWKAVTQLRVACALLLSSTSVIDYNNMMRKGASPKLPSSDLNRMAYKAGMAHMLTNVDDRLALKIARMIPNFQKMDRPLPKNLVPVCKTSKSFTTLSPTKQEVVIAALKKVWPQGILTPYGPCPSHAELGIPFKRFSDVEKTIFEPHLLPLSQ